MEGFKVSVAEILGRPGSYRDVELRRSLPGIRNALGEVAADPIDARLRIESVVEGVLVGGTTAARAEMRCARCLDPVGADLKLELCELFVAPGHEAPAEEEVYEVHGLEIDVEPMLRDALALALPLNPICREDCKGMCARCGRNLNQGECDCTTDEVDPRWADLDELRERLG